MSIGEDSIKIAARTVKTVGTDEAVRPAEAAGAAKAKQEKARLKKTPAKSGAADRKGKSETDDSAQKIYGINDELPVYLL